jgi:hypothetical protein
MDKYNQLANQIINEAMACSMHSSDEESTSTTLQDILDKYPSEIEDLKSGGEFAENLFDDLFEYYLETGEMPYGVAKARTGDPYEWMFNKLNDLGVLDHREPAEDNSNAITDEDLKTLETAKALAGGKADGGLFSNPEKQIQQAYGQMLTNVAKQMKDVAKKV